MIRRVVVIAAAGLLAGCTVSTTQPGVTVTAESPSPSSAATVGQQVRDGDFAFQVRSVSYPGRTIPGDFGPERAKGTWVVARIAVGNAGDDAGYLSAAAQYAYDAAGRRYDADPSASTLPAGDLNPGLSASGTIAWDVPGGTRIVRLELHDSLFSGGVPVAVG